MTHTPATGTPGIPSTPGTMPHTPASVLDHDHDAPPGSLPAATPGTMHTGMVGTPGTMHHAVDSSSRSFAMTPGSAPLGRTPYGMTPGSGLGASDLDGDDQAQYKHFHGCVVRSCFPFSETFNETVVLFSSVLSRLLQLNLAGSNRWSVSAFFKWETVQVSLEDKQGVVISHDAVASPPEFTVLFATPSASSERYVINAATANDREIVPCSSVTLVPPTQHEAVKVVVTTQNVEAGSIGVLSGRDSSEMIIRINGVIQILPESCIAKLNDRNAHEHVVAEPGEEALGGVDAMDLDL